MSRDVAILHGKWMGYGGGERVVAEIARTLDAPVYVGFADESRVPGDIDIRRLEHSRVERLGYAATHAGPLPGQDLYNAARFSHVPELQSYETVITTQGSVAWYVPADGQTLVRYIHAPRRWTYDRYQTREMHLPRRGYATVLRGLHAQFASYPDRYLANSDLVARRTRRYLDRDADVSVVYPPVTVDGDPTAPTEDYLLHVGRLDTCKRIGLLIRAAAAADETLRIAGRGDDEQRLRDIAAESGADVEFCGYVSESEKASLLSRAKATVFAGVQEDFGIAPVESLAAGTPVVGVDDGFTRLQIRDGINGYLCEATVPGFGAAIRRLNDHGVAWPRQRIADHATQTYGRERFRRQLREELRAATESATLAHTIDTDHATQQVASDD